MNNANNLNTEKTYEFMLPEENYPNYDIEPNWHYDYEDWINYVEEEREPDYDIYEEEEEPPVASWSATHTYYPPKTPGQTEKIINSVKRRLINNKEIYDQFCEDLYRYIIKYGKCHQCERVGTVTKFVNRHGRINAKCECITCNGEIWAGVYMSGYLASIASEESKGTEKAVNKSCP